MPQQHFSHINTWVFDLDNTLYHPSARLFDQIEVKMTAWVMQALNIGHDEANHLRDHYWKTYGTTLAGLMRVHNLDPTPYLTYVHDISLHNLAPEPALTKAIAALPGRKIVYTNGNRDHAVRVTKARGLAHVFDEMYGIEEAGFLPKPEKAAFDAIFSQARVDPNQAAMFEDDPSNLSAPYEMGMVCVHVAPEPVKKAHIHFHTKDLAAFLQNLGQS
jgi:putative hydrolase of the HAD superfamily